MRIYQLHECGGEYEDYHDYIIGSYLRSERAEEEKVKVEAKEKMRMKHHKRCINCPFIELDTSVNIDELLIENPYYCEEARLKMEEYGVDCENYYLHWDECSFYIEEIEVEE